MDNASCHRVLKVVSSMTPRWRANRRHTYSWSALLSNITLAAWKLQAESLKLRAGQARFPQWRPLVTCINYRHTCPACMILSAAIWLLHVIRNYFTLLFSVSPLTTIHSQLIAKDFMDAHEPGDAWMLIKNELRMLKCLYWRNLKLLKIKHFFNLCHVFLYWMWVILLNFPLKVGHMFV